MQQTPAVVAVCVIWLLLFSGIRSHSQCLQSNIEVCNTLKQLKASDIDVTEKIKKCRLIRHQYTSCSNEKDSIFALILHRLGDFYFSQGNIDSAIALTQQSILINRYGTRNRQESFLVNSYYNLAVFYKRINDQVTALDYFDSVGIFVAKYPVKNVWMRNSFREMSSIHFSQGSYQESIQIAETGIAYCSQFNDSLNLAFLLIQIAQSYLQLEKIEIASQKIQQAVAILSHTQYQGNYLGFLSTIQAQLWLAKKQYSFAEKFYLNADYHYAKSKASFQYNLNLLDLGNFYDNQLSQPDKAINFLKKGIAMLDSIGNPYMLCAFYINLGSVYFRKKDYETSLLYHQRALLSLPIGFKSPSLHSNPTIAQLNLVTQNYYVFELMFGKAQSQLAQYKIYNNHQLLQAARETFLLADYMIDQMRRNQTEERSKLFWRSMSKEVYRDAIETCYLLNDAGHAFYFFEKSRALLLHDKLQTTTARNFLSRAQKDKEVQLNYEVSVLKEKLSQLNPNTSLYQEAIHKLYQLEKHRTQFIKEIEKSNPKYYQYKYNSKLQSLKEVQSRLLTSGQTLVEYFYYQKDLYTLCITNTQAKIYKTNFPEYPAIAKELNRLVSNKSLLNQHYEQYVQKSSMLYSRIFKPLSIKTKKVIIATDEHFVPFEILISNVNDPDSYLIKSYVFSYLYSVAINYSSLKQKVSGSESLLAMAPVNFNPELDKSPLRGSDRSMSKIKSYFSLATNLQGKAATKENFLKHAVSSSIIHLYTHADADTNSGSSKIYFQDAALDLHDLEFLPELKTDLIMLSACKTGTGKVYSGEGVFSFSRAFAAAGIPCTITNLWDIDNHSTYKISEYFYKNLHQGLPYDEALQKAKLQFLETCDKEAGLPYYWASSVLIGRPGGLVPDRSVWDYKYLIAGCVLLFLIICSYLMMHFKRNNHKTNLLRS